MGRTSHKQDDAFYVSDFAQQFWSSVDIKKDRYEISNDDGITAQMRFFEHKKQHEALIQFLLTLPPEQEINILCAPSQMGMSAYSLAVLSSMVGLNNVHIDSFDPSEDFSKIAQEGIYKSKKNFMPKQYQSFFDFSQPKGHFMRVQDRILERVSVLDAQNLVDFKTDKNYQIVLLHDALQQLETDEIKKIGRMLANLNPNVIHMDSFRADKRINEEGREQAWFTLEGDLSDAGYGVLDSKHEKIASRGSSEVDRRTSELSQIYRSVQEHPISDKVMTLGRHVYILQPEVPQTGGRNLNFDFVA